MVPNQTIINNLQEYIETLWNGFDRKHEKNVPSKVQPSKRNKLGRESLLKKTKKAGKVRRTRNSRS